MVCQNRRRPVVSLVYWLSGGRLRDFACDAENVCNGHSMVGLHDGRCDAYPWFVLREPPNRKCHPDLSAADTDTRRFRKRRASLLPEMKIRRTLPDLVLPIHPMNRINRATLCNRSERSVRSGLHFTCSLGNWRQFPNIANLFCSRCGSLDAQANLVEKQKRECPVAGPVGLSAPGLRRLVLRSTPTWSVPCRPIRSCSAR